MVGIKYLIAHIFVRGSEKYLPHRIAQNFQVILYLDPWGVPRLQKSTTQRIIQPKKHFFFAFDEKTISKRKICFLTCIIYTRKNIYIATIGGIILMYEIQNPLSITKSYSQSNILSLSFYIFVRLVNLLSIFV